MTTYHRETIYVQCPHCDRFQWYEVFEDEGINICTCEECGEKFDALQYEIDC